MHRLVRYCDAKTMESIRYEWCTDISNVPSSHAFEEDLADLLFQLCGVRESVTREQVRNAVAQGAMILFAWADGVAGRTDPMLVGMVTLSPTPKIRKPEGRIEELVVSEHYRRQGIGKALLERVITKAREQRMVKLNWTSQEKRTEARQMYASFGFVPYDTGVFSMPL